MRPGFLLLEALIGFALFALFLTATGLTVLVSQQGTSAAAERSRATALASGALHGIMAMRDDAWGNLSAGAHGVAVVGGTWAFSGASVTTDDGYTTAVTLQEPASGRMLATATTAWQRGGSASGSVTIALELTDWRTPKAVGNWALPQEVGSWSTGDTPLFERLSVGSSVAAVAGDVSGGGPGLHLFDVSDPASPQRIASAFSLGHAAYDVLIAGGLLYVVTADPAQELRIYSLEDPAAFAAASLVGSYDLPGAAAARTLALRGIYLFVGLQQSAGDQEVYVLSVADPEGPQLEGSLDLEGGVADVAVLSDALFLASDDDVSEVRSVDVSDPSAPASGAGSGFNLADVTDARAIAVTGTSAVVGRASGEFVEELVLFMLHDGGDLSPPGPWYWEAGDAVHGLALDPSQRYGFAATAYPSREFSVLDLGEWRAGDQAIVGSVASVSGEARDVFYDPAADRAYVITRNTLSVYRPS